MSLAEPLQFSLVTERLEMRLFSKKTDEGGAGPAACIQHCGHGSSLALPLQVGVFEQWKMFGYVTFLMYIDENIKKKITNFCRSLIWEKNIPI